MLYVFNPGGEKEKAWERAVRKHCQCTSGAVHSAEARGGKAIESLCYDDDPEDN